MKKLFISALSMLAVAMGFTACSSDDDVTSTPSTPRLTTVYATTEQPSATRTSLSEGNATDGYEVLWSEGDQIKLINEASIYAEFTLDNDYAGQSTGEFTGSSLNEGTYTAYYPAGYDGTNWPTAQTYVANNIPDGVPMKAENVEVAAGDVAPISFKNEGGILRLNLKGEAKVTSITISATDLDAITLSCGTGVQLNTTTATPFYIAVPGADYPGTAYSGLKIVVTDDAGKVCTKTLKSDKTITVQRSMITDINLTASNFAFPFGQGEAAATGIGNVKWIQLWENGPKFAEYNAGATSVEDYGGYYTWGGAYANGEGITWTDDHNTTNDGSGNLTGNDDTATKLWGSKWRMPTKEELEALVNNENCTCEWTVNYNGTDINGLLCTGKGDYESNSVFLPAAGYCHAGVFGKGGHGFYWSSAPYGSNSAYSLSLFPGLQEVYDFASIFASSVRAVLAE